jgi:glutathione peroxidase
MRHFQKILSVAVGLAVLGFAFNGSAEKSEGVSILSHKMENIQGKKIDLKEYKGKVVMLVNVASECGLTPQYEGLQKLHKEYSKKGLAILGFPANNFGQQEPGTNEEIRSFCKANYGVEFDMFSKISVKGEDINPLYASLTSKKENGELGGEIEWNFTKFLVNREGKVVKRFAPRTKPGEKEVVAAIEDELKKKK